MWQIIIVLGSILLIGKVISLLEDIRNRLPEPEDEYDSSAFYFTDTLDDSSRSEDPGDSENNQRDILEKKNLEIPNFLKRKRKFEESNLVKEEIAKSPDIWDIPEFLRKKRKS